MLPLAFYNDVLTIAGERILNIFGEPVSWQLSAMT